MQAAFLGTGLMGSGFVRHMRARGLAVTVWNRSAAKAEALAGLGATVAATPEEAIRGASHIHISLSDDASVDAVLEPLAGAIGSEAWIIDHTTTAPTPTRARAARWARRGCRFVHAPVFMSPAMCASGQGLMLLAGPAAYRTALTPVLAGMTGKVVDLGDAPDRAAAFKLFGNLTLLSIVGALADVARLAHACGMEAAEAYTLFEHFNPAAGLTMRAAKIAQGDTTASFEMTMARKDLRLMVEEAAAGGAPLAMIPALAALLDERIAQGDGALDVSAVARV